jgi:hypothetical protein
VGLVLGSNQQKGLVFLELQQQGLRWLIGHLINFSDTVMWSKLLHTEIIIL